MPANKKVGVLALQGAFALHRRHIEALGAEYVEVTSLQDLDPCDSLILPGGESATMVKLLRHQGLWDSVHEFVSKKPVWGICAGAILLARSVKKPAQDSLGVIDIEIVRNGYGRQLQSSQETINGYSVSFIRAPVISEIGKGIKVFSKRNGLPTWLEKDNIIITTFHSELSDKVPSPWHSRLLELL